ncbi:MAG: PEP/pyruvate-binding domain-containing protein, partial [Candidatus Nanoarchaeia archaeon]
MPLVGGKGLNLGIMYKVKLPIPPGFVVSTDAFKSFLEYNNLDKKIFPKLKTLDIQDTKLLQETAEEIQKLITNAQMPDTIKAEIKEAYDTLNVDRALAKNLDQMSSLLGMVKAGRDQPWVAVRSSATAEDVAEASFAGQQATFLNMRGAEQVVDAVKRCWASLYTARAIYYRTKNNFQHEKVFIAVVVQKMV